MAGLNLTPIESSGRGSRTPLADIQENVKDTVEEAWAWCQENATGRLQSDPFPTKQDADDWLSEARAYAYQREAGRVVVNGNASRAPKEDGTKDKVLHVVRFRVEPYVAPESEPTPSAD